MTGPYTVHPEWLGDPTFTRQHGSRFAYVVGEMARGIATPHMVVEAVRAGLVGFYGSAGLRPETIAAGLDEIEAGLGKGASAWGANLIHSPQQPGYERAVVDLFLERGVTRVSASAFMTLSKEIVRYSARGLSRGADGRIRYFTRQRIYTRIHIFVVDFIRKDILCFYTLKPLSKSGHLSGGNQTNPAGFRYLHFQVWP